MAHKKNNKIRALAGLGMVAVLGGLAPVFMKVVLVSLSPIEIVFWRFSVALAVVGSLFIIQKRRIDLSTLIRLIPSGLFFSGNIFLFVFGLVHTTGIISQLFYLLSPVLVSVGAYVLFAERLTRLRIISVSLCTAGALIIVFRSATGTVFSSLGTIEGNLLVLGAVTSWSLYILYTKKIGSQINALSFLLVNFFFCWVASAVTLFGFSGLSPSEVVANWYSAGLLSWGGILFLGLFNSVLMFFLYQWSIRHVSAFVVASSTYLSPLVTASLAIPLFGERLSWPLIVSALLIAAGAYTIAREQQSKQERSRTA